MTELHRGGKMTKDELIVGALYRYKPQRTHCRHGLAIVCKSRQSGELYAVDTYWMGDPGPVDLNESLVDFEFVLDLNNARKVDRDTYEVYEQSDKAYIPMGGSSERFYVHNDAKPSRELRRQQLTRWIEDAEHRSLYEQRRAQTLKEQLAQLEAN